jgi:hypothetical protein
MTKKSKQRKPTTANEKPVELSIPANFNTVLYDFVNDLITAFPEYGNVLVHWHNKDLPQPVLNEVFLYFTKVYPERFFDILYQNEDIFAKDSTVNVCFLPNIDFKLFYNCDGVSENTRNAIWKYLQLVLVSILGSIQDKKHFGETMNMFDGVDEAALQEKLAETIDGISDFFKHLGVNTESDGDCPDLMSEEATKEFFEKMGAGLGEDPTERMPDINEMFDKMKEDMPKAEDLHEHLKGLFDGKIGTLAKELAEEISSDMQDMFGGDTSNIKSTQDLLKKMIKNPKKIMDLMKTIGNKLQQKMKSGEISEQDIMKEAGEILGKMKGMGGKDGKDFTEMFKNLTKTMGGGLGKTKMNMGALNQFSKQFAMKERLQQKLEQKRADRETVVDHSVHLSAASNTTDNYVFSLDNDEKQEKSFRRPLSAEDIAETVPVSSPVLDDEWMNDNTSGNAGEKSASKKKKKKK